MNIIGIPKANDGSIRDDQNNNAVEKLNRGLLAELLAKLKTTPQNQWLAIVENWIPQESCSKAGLSTILEGMKYFKDLPEFMRLTIQASDFFMMHINNPKNDNIYSSGLKFDNRRLKNIQKMLDKMGIYSEIIDNPGFYNIRKHYVQGRGALLHRKGHYFAGIGYDPKTNENIHHDPNGTSRRNKNGGRFERLTLREWNDTKILHALIIWPAG